MKTLLRVAALAALVAVAAYGFTFQVDENEVAFVTRFGDPRRRVDEPGLHFKWPPPIDAVVRVDLRTRVLDPDAGEFLTQDKKNVVVAPFMAWTVADPLKFIRTVGTTAAADLRLTDVLRSVIGDVLSSVPFSDLVSAVQEGAGTAEVARRATGLAAAAAAENFGVRVVAVRVKRLNFPPSNKEAVFRRMEADREAIAEGFRSEGSEQYEKMKAEADREQARLLSEARRKAEELRGEADSQALRILGEAYALDPELYAFLTKLELWEKALGEGSTIVIPSDHELLDVLKPSAIPGGGAGGTGE